MDVEEQLLIQRLSARIGELEGWLAMLIAGHGQRNGQGFRYSLCADHALDIRSRMRTAQPAVSVEYDFERDRHNLDVQ